MNKKGFPLIGRLITISFLLIIARQKSAMRSDETKLIGLQRQIKSLKVQVFKVKKCKSNKNVILSEKKNAGGVCDIF